MLKVKPIFWIVLAELLGTSLWFSANSAADGLKLAWNISQTDIGWLTTAVQLGFILGTLFFSISGWADRFPASKIFGICSVFGSICNACFAFLSTDLQSAIIFRFLVGLSLAGIYPLGMKLIISWDPENSGKSLGILVGMLTLGTALPHGIRSVGQVLSWQTVILVSSCLALIATTIVWRLGEGPHLNKSSRKTSWKLDSIFQAFKLPRFRASALGYFGHMWELYAFWTLVPMLLALCFKEKGYSQSLNISLWAFGIIGVGAIGCIVGGMLSQKIGSAKVAWYALMTSGMMCLLYPFFDEIDISLKLAILFIWGISVVADSPQFSAMSAKACPQDLIGTALTIQNSIGFGLTILSILFVTAEIDQLGSKVVWILLPGPIFGLFFIKNLFQEA